MHYYRYPSAEISCWYKYLLFSYNIIFWVSPKSLAGVAFLGAGLWAWSEKGVLSDLSKMTRLHSFDPVFLILFVGGVMFILGFAGCVGALRENICLLKFVSCWILVYFCQGKNCLGRTGLPIQKSKPTSDAKCGEHPVWLRHQKYVFIKLGGTNLYKGLHRCPGSLAAQKYLYRRRHLRCDFTIAGEQLQATYLI
ncbi:Tetraspanin-14, partial [Ophiophagus hannah]